MTIRAAFRLVVATLLMASGLALISTVAGPVAPAGALPGSFVVDAGSPKTFTVPAYVRQIQVTARGGSGQNGHGRGGAGGYAGAVTTTLQVTPGDVLHLAAGGSGSHGGWVAPGFGGGSGGAGDPNGESGGNGGSASVVWVNDALTVVAAGGGGGGGEGGNPFTTNTGGPGGNGSGLPGTSGDGPAAGAGGIGAVTGRSDGVGGNGGSAAFGAVAGGGGGGGGGWLPSLNAGGGVAGDAGRLGGGGGGGGAGGTSWAAVAATRSVASVHDEGQIVLRWAPRPIVTINVSPNPALYGAEVRIDTHVGVPLPSAPVATGRVGYEVLDIETGAIDEIAAGPIENGSTWFSTTGFSLGQNFIRVVYYGDSYYEAATTGWYNLLVENPHASLSAAVGSLDFGTQQVGTVANRTVTFTNTGNVPVTPNGVSSTDLAFQVTGWTSATLAPGASCEVILYYYSATPGTSTGRLTIHDANGTSASVDLTGRSVVPLGSASATSLAFGDVTIGTSLKRTVTITNTGETPWDFASPVAVGNRAFTFSSACVGTLDPKAWCRIFLTYAPTATTKQSGYIVVTDVSGRVKLVITYNGTGKAPAPVVTKIAPTTGTAAGGTRVTITGSNLANAGAVRFGTHAARSFSCTSSTTCTAVSPAGTRGSVVDLRVVTAGGTSAMSTVDRFRYTA